MGYTSREFAASLDSVNSYDTPLSGLTPLDGGATMGCNNQMVIAIAVIQGPSAFVQGAATATSGAVTTTSLAFSANNTGGNCLVIDVSFSQNAFPAGSQVTCTDTQGNSYVNVGMGDMTGTVRRGLPSGGLFGAIFVCMGCAAGANTVTVTCLNLLTSDTSFPVTLAIHEYAGGGAVLGDLTVSSGESNFGAASTSSDNVPITASQSVMGAVGSGIIHMAIFIAIACPGSPFAVTGGSPLNPPFLTPSWLLVDEPSIGITDRSPYLFLGDGAQHSFNLQSKQRGNATYTLVSNPDDPTSAPTNYVPTLFQPIYLFDQDNSATGWAGAPTGWCLVFAGILQQFIVRWVSTNGLRYIDCTAVSLESILDTVYAEPVQYVNETCGFIFADLFTRFESGSPVTLGTVQAGPTIPLFNAQLGDKLSDLFEQLATTAQFIWGVNPQTQQLYFQLPTVTAAPFQITSLQALWDTISNKTDGNVYRNRQAVKLSYDAFAHSMEFFTGSGQQTFTLMRPVQQVTNAYVTLSTPNHATGTLSGLPSAGDTITIGPASGVWQATHIYALGGVIVVAGFVFKVTTAGTSGGTIPAAFLTQTATGDTVTDNSVIWTCQGPLGLGTGSDVYTFVTTLDNTQFGQILILGTVALQIQAIADAINATAAQRTVTISLPTWENSQCNAVSVTGTSFTLQQKAAGTGYVSSLSTTSSAFSWSAASTSGGSSPQGSVGPNEGATISISVYAQGTSTAAPGLSYTEGSAVVGLATPLNSGTNLNVEYTRVDGNVIEVEDTPLVTALAIVTGGTGKYQQMSDQSSTGLISTSSSAGLQFAQEALAAYDVAPEEIEVQLHQPGILPGQALTLDLSPPLDELNGTYFVEEVQGEIVPTFPWLDNPNAVGAGHYRYTAKLIDIAQIASYMDFWLGLQGGGAGGQGGALVATSGGGNTTGGTSPTTGGVDEQTASYLAVAGDNGKLIVFNAPSSPLINPTLTLPATPPSPQWNIFVENIGLGTLTISPNGLNLDGSASNLTPIATNQGVYISTDGTNYFSERGLSSGGGSSVTLQTNSINNSSQATLNVENGTNTTASNPSGGVVQIAVATATSGVLGVVKPDGTVITVSAGAITVPDATSSSLGVVKPDGTIITVSAGAITVPDGTNSSLGVVQADGTTTSISSGIISALGGAGLVSGACFLPAFSVAGASSNVNWENLTITNSWSGLNLNFFPAAGKWKIKLLFTAGSPAIGNMVIKRTLNHSLAVVDTTSVTIGGVSNPSLTTPGLVTTDAILLALDSTHDYYFMIFFSNVAGNASVGVANTFTGASAPFIFSFDPSGDQTGVTTISTGSGHANILVTGLYVA